VTALRSLVQLDRLFDDELFAVRVVLVADDFGIALSLQA
jgi:hypothetical protein